MKTETVISEELALEEMKKLILKLRLKKYENKADEILRNMIKEDFDYIIEMLMNGKLIFDNNMIPSYKLTNPITNAKGEVIHDVLVLKTRIKPTALSSILDTVGPNKVGTLNIAYMAHIVGFATVLYFDKIDIEDFEFLQNFSVLFINSGY